MGSKIQEALGLLNSMVTSGEQHSETSKQLVEEALAELKGLQPRLGDWEGLAEVDRFLFMEALSEQIDDLYWCSRSWSAWGAGTMRETDFALITDDGDDIAERAEELWKAFCRVVQKEKT